MTGQWLVPSGSWGALRFERRHETSDTGSVVLDAIELLAPREREVLLLTYWDGLTAVELSELLDISASAVRMRLHRARKELARALQSEEL
ncbi:RNA polymerase sigma factor [Pseudarthrobacter sp. J1738]|uniref:RNA polymerase sigma factor n=1 Tax=unclassified Pseudarthrobacter TaxID=2647000 RepID=UPI003D2A5D22